MHIATALSLTLVLVSPLATAAAQVTSPRAYAGVEGNSDNTMPLSQATVRYMQVHGDLPKSAPRVIRAVALRRDGASTLTSGRARTVDVEMWVGPADHRRVGTRFASNFTASATRVIRRRNVALPAWNRGPSIGPPAVFAFDAPWTLPAGADIAWELRVFANSAAGADMPADGFDRSGLARGALRMFGKGCLTKASRSRPMELTADAITDANTGQTTIRWAVAQGTPRSPGLLLVGFARLGAPVPGLCGHGMLWTIPTVVLVSTADRSGNMTFSPLSIWYWPGVRGVEIYSQALTATQDQPRFPFATSNGLRATLPGPPATNVLVHRVFATAVNATTGTREAGVGVVTEFR